MSAQMIAIASEEPYDGEPNGEFNSEVGELDGRWEFETDGSFEAIEFAGDEFTLTLTNGYVERGYFLLTETAISLIADDSAWSFWYAIVERTRDTMTLVSISGLGPYDEMRLTRVHHTPHAPLAQYPTPASAALPAPADDPQSARD